MALFAACAPLSEGPTAPAAPKPVAAERVSVRQTRISRPTCIRNAPLDESAANPLYLLNGVMLGRNANGTIDHAAAERALRALRPDDIEKLDVLTGASATALYGSMGRHGAISIVTKRTPPPS